MLLLIICNLQVLYVAIIYFFFNYTTFKQGKILNNLPRVNWFIAKSIGI